MKSFIICLSKIESSLETALVLKKQLEAYNMPVELFEGTYGTDAVKMMAEEGRTIHPFGIKGPNPRTPAPENDDSLGKLNRPGVLGCFYSHYNLWKKCVELNEAIIIWEDDIVLTRPFIPVEWEDVLLLALGHPNKSQRYKQYLESPEGDPSTVLLWHASMPGACGYAIKPHAAKKLVDTYENTFLPADNAINQYHVKIEVHTYIMGRALVDEDGKQSLTRGKFWKTYDRH